MPKSNREMARASMARRRERAREAGLCYTCCTQKPNLGRIVCQSCNAAKAERKKRKRQRIGDLHNSRQVLIGHERAGDVASQHHFHDGAAQHYQDALAVHTISETDRSRLSEKLAYVLFRSGNPDAANKWLERALPQHLD